MEEPQSAKARLSANSLRSLSKTENPDPTRHGFWVTRLSPSTAYQLHLRRLVSGGAERTRPPRPGAPPLSRCIGGGD